MPLYSFYFVCHYTRKGLLYVSPFFFFYKRVEELHIIERFFGQFAFFSMILQKMTAATVLVKVATIPGPTIAAGFPLPYWLR